MARISTFARDTGSPGGAQSARPGLLRPPLTTSGQQVESKKTPCGTFPATARRQHQGRSGPPLPRSRCSSSTLGWPSSARLRVRCVARMAARVRSPMMPSSPPGIEPPRGQQALQLLALGPVERLVVRLARPPPAPRRRRCGRRDGRRRARRTWTGCICRSARKLPETRNAGPRAPAGRISCSGCLERRIVCGCDGLLHPCSLPLGTASCCGPVPTRRSRSSAAG